MKGGVKMIHPDNINLSAISHEITSPIGIALSAIELLEAKVSKSGEIYDSGIKDLFDIASTNIHKTLRIAYNFIDADRLKCQKYSIQIVPQNISLILNQNFKMLEKFLKFKNIKFDFICHLPDVCIADVDENVLSRIILNLISNSIKHLPRENSKIIVKAELVDGFITISVIDNGSGITKDKLPHISEEYWHDTSDNSVDKHSIGLGLYIVKNLIDLHAGYIFVNSEPFMQTVFKIQFPQKHFGAKTNVLSSTSSHGTFDNFMKEMCIEFSDCFVDNNNTND